jgi:hypothetical protein
VTFEAIETQGVDAFLKQIQDELNDRTYVPLPARKQEILRKIAGVTIEPHNALSPASTIKNEAASIGGPVNFVNSSLFRVCVPLIVV